MLLASRADTTLSSRSPQSRVFPGNPVVKTLSFHYREHKVPFLDGELRTCIPKTTTITTKKQNPTM